MNRVKGRYRNQKLELDQPLNLPEGAEVEIEIHSLDEQSKSDQEEWETLGMGRLEEE